MAKGDLVAAELARLAVEIAAAHARAEIAWRLLDAARDIENIRLEDRDWDVQQRCVALDLLPVDGVVAWVHDEVDDFERHVAVPLQQLQELYMGMPTQNVKYFLVRRENKLKNYQNMFRTQILQCSTLNKVMYLI